MSSIRLRDQIWTVRSQLQLGDRAHFELLHPQTGEILRALCPPEEYEVIADKPPEFADRARSPWQTWLDHHEALAFSCWEGGRFAALFAGRISPEPFQFAPVERLMNLPKPNLLIADDVGLGKTIEAGICMLELIARGRGKRILLIVPPSLIDQWQSEMLEKFQLRFDALENAAAVEKMQTRLAEGIRPWSYLARVVTSTEFIKKPEIHRAALDHPWDIIVVDEAHYLAESGTGFNPYTTARTRMGRLLRDKTRSLILLTATPHNGHRHSFRSLLEMIEPADATLAGDAEVIRRRVGRNMIRRLKQQITRTDQEGKTRPAFPPREPIRCIEVSQLPEIDAEIMRKVSAYCAKTTKDAEDTDDRDLVSFAMQIVKKRMLSSRTALHRTVLKRLDALKSQADEDAKPSPTDIRELQGDLPLNETMQEATENRILRSGIHRDTRRRNAERRTLQAIARLLDKTGAHPDPKVTRLLEDIEQHVLAEPEEKAIIFTEYLDTLDAIKTALARHPTLKDAYVELTGGLQHVQRRTRIARFHEPGCRLLLATDAASEGLNLQYFCRRIYHVELPWNPNRMEQRNGRVDRHGQKRTPIIKYLYYPDSPEDRILDILVQKIATMQADQVSTPDMLGLYAECRIEDTLTRLNAEESGPQAATRLLQALEQQQNLFVKDLGGLLAGGVSYGRQIARDNLSADPLLLDDIEFEVFMLRRLNAHLQPTALAHAYQLKTPRDLRGPRVEAAYPCVTFRRSVAVQHPARDVEYIHRLHPLFQAMTAEARAALTLTLTDQSSNQRLAVRRWSGLPDNRPAILFTFLDHLGDRPTLMLEAYNVNGAPLALTWNTVRGMQQESPGEVDWAKVADAFGGTFNSLQTRAAEDVHRKQQERFAQLSEQRAREVAVLRDDAARYQTDRLLEIDEEEKRQQQGPQQQLLLFREKPVGLEARRAAVRTHFNQRRKELDDYANLPTPAAPQPLGVILIFPVKG